MESERQRVAMLQQEDEKKRAAALADAEAAKEAAKQKANALALARNLQTELRRVGCDPGNADGKWDNKSRDALKDFARLTKIAIPSDEPTNDALSALTQHKLRVCPLRCAANQKEANGRCVAVETPKPAKRQADTPAKQNSSNEKQPMCYHNGPSRLIVPCSDSSSTGVRAY